MILRRLHRQIYLTVLAGLLVVAVITATTFALTDDDGDIGPGETDATAIAELILPPPGAPDEDVALAVKRTGDAFNMNISVFDADRKLIASRGKSLSAPIKIDDEPGWQHHHEDRGWFAQISGDRIVVVQFTGARKGWIGILLLIGSIAIGVGLASYPLIRRITGRLGRLQRAVEQVGQGDLSARVKVEGRDEIANLAESFNRSAERIENLVQSQRMLLANASHELRTPLARIRMGIELLGQDGSERRRDGLKQDIGELDQLIEELMVLTRLEDSSQPLQRQTVDLIALVAEECAHYKECHYLGDIPTIQAEPHMLQRAVRNLLDNCARHGTPPIQVQLSNVDGQVRIYVTDKGPGISRQDSAKIFQPFFRGADRQNVDGAGLGLPIVHQIAEAHGGAARLEENLDGALFVAIYLPATE